MGVDDGSSPMDQPRGDRLGGVGVAVSCSGGLSDARYLARLSPGECKASWVAVFGRVQSILMRT